MLIRLTPLLAGLLLLGGCHSHGRSYRGYAGSPTVGFWVTWKLVDARANPPDPKVAPALACEAAGITAVRLDLLNQDSGQNFSFTWDCRLQATTTPDLTIGAYSVTALALDAAGVVRSEARFFSDNYYGNDLGLVVFLVHPP